MLEFEFRGGRKNVPEIFVVGSDQQGNVAWLLIVGSSRQEQAVLVAVMAAVVVVMVVVVVQVGTLAGHALTFGEQCRQLQLQSGSGSARRLLAVIGDLQG